jgi:hypothetical protein
MNKEKPSKVEPAQYMQNRSPLYIRYIKGLQIARWIAEYMDQVNIIVKTKFI